MEKVDFLNRLTAIGSCEDDVERRELLSALSEEASKDYDTLATLTTTNETLLNDNEKLRNANMKLFLRVGEEKDEADTKKNNTGVKDEPEKRNFSDLFDKEGRIK